MMNLGKIYARIFAIFLLGILIAPHVVFAGFGVSPPRVLEDRLVPGSHFERTVYLVQGDPEQDVTVEATIESRDIKDWISLEQGTEFVIPEGVQQYPLNIIIDVPEDAELGAYKGFVRVKTVPQNIEAEGAGVAIALGGLIEVDIEVGDDVIVDFKVTSLDILDIVEREPLKARVTIDNTGNVPVAPDSASFELFDKFGNIRLAFATAEVDQFPKVPSFTKDSVTLEFPIDTVLAPGEYWGHVKIYNEDGRIVRELRTIFNVHERNAAQLLNALSLPVALGIGGGIVLLAVVVLIIRAIRRRRRKKSASISQTDERKRRMDGIGIADE